MSQSIKIIHVETDEDLQEFIKLPHEIYKYNPYWPGQNDEVEEKSHKPEFNYALNYLKTRLFYAVQDGQVVGRISAIVNPIHNKQWNEKAGFFGHFECINNSKISNALFTAVEEWLYRQGCEVIYGPWNYTYYGIIGILIQGFNDRPTIDLPFNPVYYQTLIENEGFFRFKDMIEVLGSSEDLYKNSQQRYEQVEYLLQSGRFQLRKIDEENLCEELLKVFSLYDESFVVWPFKVLTAEEWLSIFKDLYPLIPKELFMILEEEGKPIAFFFAEPDYNEDIFNATRGIDGPISRIKAFVMGIKKEYQSLGINRIFFGELGRIINYSQYKEVSYSWVDMDNTSSVKMSMALGGPIDKIFRLYQKNLKK